MCKGFDWFRHLQLHALLGDTQLMQLDSEQLTPENLQQQLANCFATEDEALLLQQLSAQPLLDAVADLTSALHGSHPLQERINSSSSTNINTSSLTPADLSSSSYSQPLAPPEDPLWLLKHVLTQPPPPCCANLEAMTLQELQAHYKATVHDLSLWLVQYTAGGIAGPTELEAKIQAALTEHLQLIGQLCTVRSELVTALQLVSSDCDATAPAVKRKNTRRCANALLFVSRRAYIQFSLLVVVSCLCWSSSLLQSTSCIQRSTTCQVLAGVMWNTVVWFLLLSCRATATLASRSPSPTHSALHGWLSGCS
jgi:hypothetical protein